MCEHPPKYYLVSLYPEASEINLALVTGYPVECTLPAGNHAFRRFCHGSWSYSHVESGLSFGFYIENDNPNDAAFRKFLLSKTPELLLERMNNKRADFHKALKMYADLLPSYLQRGEPAHE